MLVLPALFTICFALLYPLLYAFYLSLFHISIGRTLHFSFVGIGNYLSLVRDSSWWNAFRNTGYFVLADIFIGIPLGFISASTLNKKLKFQGLILAIILLPYVLPPIVLAFIWKWAFAPDYGFINQTLMHLHIIKNTVYWLTNPRLALPSLIIANLWQGTAFATIVYLGGMKSIPRELYEAARIDGASYFQTVTRITIPLLMPFTTLLFVMKTIMTFKIFELVYAVTGGGPAGTTNVVSVEIYKAAFESFRFGKATAMSYMLLFIVAVLVLIYGKIFKAESGGY